MEITKYKELASYKLNEETFDKVLETYKHRIQVSQDLHDYLTGFQNRYWIFYNGFNTFICVFNLVNDVLPDDYRKAEKPDWYQCIFTRNQQINEPIQRSISGGMAWKYVKGLILKHYSEDEFNYRLHLFQANYDNAHNQLHYNYMEESNVVHKYSNCVKYDINGAYANALIEIFPKASCEILKLYNERKKKPINKDYINFFVGMFCRTGHRKTYNYIVQKVRSLMDSTVDRCQGILLYANTDGFAVCQPKQAPTNVGKDLGQFKVEYEGDIYTYTGTNYWIMQCGDEIKGNCFYQVRNQIDLRKGEVVSYNRYSTGHVVYPCNIKLQHCEIREEM